MGPWALADGCQLPWAVCAGEAVTLMFSGVMHT